MYMSRCSESFFRLLKLTFDGLLGSGLQPGQGADLRLPDQTVGMAEAQLLHHELDGGADLGRIRVAPVHDLRKIKGKVAMNFIQFGVLQASLIHANNMFTKHKDCTCTLCLRKGLK